MSYFYEKAHEILKSLQIPKLQKPWLNVKDAVQSEDDETTARTTVQPRSSEAEAEAVPTVNHPINKASNSNPFKESIILLIVVYILL